jgi:hypothetical protein
MLIDRMTAARFPNGNLGAFRFNGQHLTPAVWRGLFAKKIYKQGAATAPTAKQAR